jgi:hypothetical protein
LLVVIGAFSLFAIMPIFISIALARPCFGGAACQDQTVLLPYLAIIMGACVLLLIFGLLTRPRKA